MGSQIRPRIVGPGQRVKLFATRTLFFQKVLRFFFAADHFLKIVEILPSIQLVKVVGFVCNILSKFSFCFQRDRVHLPTRHSPYMTSTSSTTMTYAKVTVRRTPRVVNRCSSLRPCASNCPTTPANRERTANWLPSAQSSA